MIGDSGVKNWQEILVQVNRIWDTEKEWVYFLVTEE